jgi:hypothetical protein
MCPCISFLYPETSNASDCNGHAEWQTIVLSDDPHFNLSYMMVAYLLNATVMMNTI